jgi:hypothetical protein
MYKKTIEAPGPQTSGKPKTNSGVFDKRAKLLAKRASKSEAPIGKSGIEVTKSKKKSFLTKSSKKKASKSKVVKELTMPMYCKMLGITETPNRLKKLSKISQRGLDVLTRWVSNDDELVDFLDAPENTESDIEDHIDTAVEWYPKKKKEQGEEPVYKKTIEELDRELKNERNRERRHLDRILERKKKRAEARRELEAERKAVYLERRSYKTPVPEMSHVTMEQLHAKKFAKKPHPNALKRKEEVKKPSRKEIVAQNVANAKKVHKAKNERRKAVRAAQNAARKLELRKKDSIQETEGLEFEIFNSEAYESVKRLYEGIDPRYAVFVADMIAFVHQLRMCNSYVQYASICYTHIRLHFPKIPDTADYVRTLIVDSYPLVRRLFGGKDVMETEGLSELDMLSVFLDSSLVTSLRNIVVALLAFKFDWKDKSMRSMLKAFFGKPRKMSMLDFMVEAKDFYVRVVRFASKIRSGMSFKEAFLYDDETAIVSRNIENLMLYRDHTYHGLPVEGRMDISSYVAEGERLIDASRQCQKILHPLSKECNALQSRTLSLQKDIMDKKSTLFSRKRRTPFGIVLHGDPGVGKGQILPVLTQWYSEVKNREHSDALMYSRVVSSQYFDGYDPFANPYIHYSETGGKSLEQIRREGDTVINEICSLIDSLPFCCDMSSVDDKGRVYALPDLVLIDTNNESMHLNHLVSNPAAVRRRFLYIEQVVKPEFRRDDGSCGLDYEKSVNSGRDILDKWDFIVREYVPQNNIQSGRNELFRGDIYALRDFVKSKYNQHIRQQEDIQAMVADSVLLHPDQEPEGDDDDMVVPYVQRVLPRQVLYHYRDFMCFILSWYIALGPYIAFTREFLYASVQFITLASFYFFLKVGEMFFSHAYGKVLPFRIRGYQVFILSYMFSFWWAWWLPIGWLFLMMDGGALLKIFQGGTYAKAVAVLGLKMYTNPTRMSLKKSIRKLGFLIGFYDSPNLPEEGSIVAEVAVVLSTFCAIYYIYLRLRRSAINSSRCDDYLQSEASTFRLDSEHNETLEDLESGFHCGKSYTRISNKLDSYVWNLKIRENPALFTDSPDGLIHAFKTNIRRAAVKSEVACIRTHIFGVCGSYALVNTHTFAGKEEAVLAVSTSGVLKGEDLVFKETRITSLNRVDLGNDISLVDLTGIRFKNAVLHFTRGDDLPAKTKGCVGLHETSIFYKPGSIDIIDKRLGAITLTKYFAYSDPNHAKGKCGLPIAILRDRGSTFVGIHASGGRITDTCTGPLLTQEKLREGMESLRLKSPYFELHSRSDDMTTESMEDPGVKSPFRYEALHGVDYYGKLPGPIMVNDKSSLVRSEFADDIDTFVFDEFGFIPKQCYMRPLMKPRITNGQYISPFNVNLKKLAGQKASLDHVVLHKCIDRLLRRLLEEVRCPRLSPLDMESAVNGVDNDPFLRRITASTSAGYPYSGKKSEYIPLVEDTTREAVDELKAAITTMLLRYQHLQTNQSVYVGKLKDEPRSYEKVRVGKTRMFYMQGLDKLIVDRMFLAPFYTLMVEQGDAFCTSIGINMHANAQKIVNDLVEFSPFIMEGDYSNYDQRMPFDISRAAFTIVHNFLSEKGYNLDSQRIVKGILTDNLFPLVEVNRDLMEVSGLQPSGKYATAEDNSLKGLLLLMYAWYAHPDLKEEDFFEGVLPRIYGDDVLAAVKPKYSHVFNNTYYSKFCSDNYRMDYTSAAKKQINDDFLDIHTCSFLKRRFVFKDDIQRWVAPLDLESIYKSLIWRIPSKFVTKNEQLLSTYVSACYELFFHSNRNQYDRCREFLIGILMRLDADEHTVRESLPTFDDILNSISQ